MAEQDTPLTDDALARIAFVWDSRKIDDVTDARYAGHWTGGKVAGFGVNFYRADEKTKEAGIDFHFQVSSTGYEDLMTVAETMRLCADVIEQELAVQEIMRTTEGSE